MQRLMQISNKVDQKLQGLIRSIILRPRQSNVLIPDPILQNISNIPNCAKDVTAFLPCPPALPWKQAGLRRMIIEGTDVVKSGGPAHFKADSVGPRRYGCQMA
jgi:hypothetical protein